MIDSLFHRNVSQQPTTVTQQLWPPFSVSFCFIHYAFSSIPCIFFSFKRKKVATPSPLPCLSDVIVMWYRSNCGGYRRYVMHRVVWVPDTPWWLLLILFYLCQEKGQGGACLPIHITIDFIRMTCQDTTPWCHVLFGRSGLFYSSRRSFVTPFIKGRRGGHPQRNRHNTGHFPFLY